MHLEEGMAKENEKESKTEGGKNSVQGRRGDDPPKHYRRY